MLHFLFKIKYLILLMSLTTTTLYAQSFKSEVTVSSFPLDTIFGWAWTDERLKNKQILLPIKISQKSNLEISLKPSDFKLRIKKGIVYLENNKDYHELIYQINKNATYLGVAFANTSTGKFKIQFIESKGKEYLSSSPLIAWPEMINSDAPVINVTIMDLPHAVTARLKPDDIVTLTSERHNTLVRSKRSAVHSRAGVSSASMMACFINPLLAVYNYIIQGRCNQVDNIFNSVIDFFSSKKPDAMLKLSGPEPLPAKSKLLVPNYGYGYIKEIKLGKSILSAYAAAKTCHVSIDYVLSKRKRRSPDDDCIYSTEDIISTYTRVFGNANSTWHQAHFDSVINNILTTGHTGEHLAEADEYSLVVAVELQRTLSKYLEVEYGLAAALQAQGEYLVAMGHAANFGPGWMARESFAQAQQAYANYVDTALNTLSNNVMLPPIASPQVVQETAALGFYELEVDSYIQQSAQVLPRIYTNGIWQQQPALQFETEVIRIDQMTGEQRQNILDTVRQWHTDYRNFYPDIETLPGSVDLVVLTQIIRTVPLAVKHLELALAGDRDNTYPKEKTFLSIARLNGRVISLLMAVKDYHSGEDYRNNQNLSIEYVLSEPRSSLPASPTQPAIYLEGAILGADQATVRSLAEYASNQRIRGITSFVVSQPAVIIHEKMGFRPMI